MPDNCHVAAWRCSQIDLTQVRGGLKQQEIYSKARRTLPVPTIFLRASSVFFRFFFLWRWWCAASRSDNSDGNEKTNDRIKWRQIIYFTKFMLLLLLNCYTARCYRLPPFVTTVYHTHSGELLVFPKTQPNSTTLIFLWLIYYDLLDRMSERAEAKHFVCVIFCGIACTNRP